MYIYICVRNMWWSVFFVLFNYKKRKKENEKKYKRCVIPAIAELVFKTNNCTWPVGPLETHTRARKRAYIYILYTIKKCLIIEHWRVCLHLSLRARVGYFQQWRNVNSSFSANSKSFSIFNSKGSRLWGLVTKKVHSLWETRDLWILTRTVLEDIYIYIYTHF